MKVLTAGGVACAANNGRARAGGRSAGGRSSNVIASKKRVLRVDAAPDEESPPPPADACRGPSDGEVEESVGPANGDSDASSRGGIGPNDGDGDGDNGNDDGGTDIDRARLMQMRRTSVKLDDLYSAPPVIQGAVEREQELSLERQQKSKASDILWLSVCFFGIMGSFVAYGLLLEYATSGGKKLHELSFLFVTSLLYTVTASVGRYARAEKPSTIPPAQFAVLGLTSMGSTFFSVRALRYVIFPIQVLAKSCKPVPVMLMGAIMGKKYPLKKYLKVGLIVAGVGLFMGGG